MLYNNFKIKIAIFFYFNNKNPKEILYIFTKKNKSGKINNEKHNKSGYNKSEKIIEKLFSYTKNKWQIFESEKKNYYSKNCYALNKKIIKK